MNALAPLLEGPELVVAPGVHDALTARIAAAAGHGALYLGGNAMAMGLGKGQPFITLTETAELVRRVKLATGLTLLVDAGAGFGDLPHLDLAVRELEAAGADALHIDDQPYPKPPGYHRRRGSIVDTGAMVARLETALAARCTDMLIVARTDALRVTGSLDEAVTRCRAYAAAGADALMPLDLSPAQAPILREALGPIPFVWIGGVHPPVPTTRELRESGFAMACYPFNGLAAMTGALADLWSCLAVSGAIEQDPEVLERARRDSPALSGLARAFEVEDRHAD